MIRRGWLFVMQFVQMTEDIGHLAAVRGSMTGLGRIGGVLRVLVEVVVVDPGFACL